MRLKIVGGVVILALALIVVACGGGSASSSTTNTGSIQMNVHVEKVENYKPSVRLECVKEPDKGQPCGSNPSRNEWNGHYRAITTGFPKNAVIMVTVIGPNGPYPLDQYTPGGSAYGVEGNKQETNEYGELPEFKWSTYNEAAPVDPPGIYKLTFHFEAGGKPVEVHAQLKMAHLP